MGTKSADGDAARKGFEKWEATTLRDVLAQSPERRASFATESGIPVQRVYTPADLAGLDYERELGYPGEFPYTRGVYPTMYRGRHWTMRNYAGFGTAADTNHRFRHLLSKGMRGLSVAFDLPTQLGYDSDDPLAEGAVGRVGVAVDTVADMETIFRDIPLDKVSTSMTINAPATVLLAMYLVLGEKQGVPAAQLTGTTQNDILKEFIARGTYIFPPGPSLKLTLDLVEYCFHHVPQWNTLSITGYHFREAGADAVQELAFTMATTVAYLEQALERNLDIDSIAPRLSYSLGAFRDLFEEVAKFRAARRLFARIMKDRFHAKDPKSMLFRTYSGSCGSTLVAQEPINNVVRIAMHALMGILGGHQAIHTASWDEGHALPSEEAATLALRTQQILAHESGLCNTIDPLAGSYYVESLTTEIETRAARLLEEIDGLGGTLAAIEQGFFARQIQASSMRQQKSIDAGETVVVGLNKFNDGPAAGMDPQQQFQIDPGLEQHQRKKVAEVRSQRDSAPVRAALRQIRQGIAAERNLMPDIIAAVKAYATIGEICGAMREEWGEFRHATYF